jgi:hypothetical protein
LAVVLGGGGGGTAEEPSEWLRLEREGIPDDLKPMAELMRERMGIEESARVLGISRARADQMRRALAGRLTGVPVNGRRR